jgi:hypothetical protein
MRIHNRVNAFASTWREFVAFGLQIFAYTLHQRYFFGKTLGFLALGPTLTTLVLVLRAHYQRGWLAWWLYFGQAALSLICSRFTLRTLSYDDLPSRSTGKLKKSHLGWVQLTVNCSSSSATNLSPAMEAQHLSLGCEALVGD